MTEKEAQAGEPSGNSGELPKSVNYELCYEPDGSFVQINGVHYVPEAALSSLREELEKVKAERDRFLSILEMKLPTCSCYRSLGQCERCRILEPANLGEAKREGERE